ncbi:hypothetical protein E2320_005804, partial [Naja naja]
DIGGDLAL